jgi:hypothetical protein
MPMNNAERAGYAEQAVRTYCLEKDGRDSYDNRITEAADLISDLLHLIRREGGSVVYENIQMAIAHFEVEEKQEKEG